MFASLVQDWVQIGMSISVVKCYYMVRGCNCHLTQKGYMKALKGSLGEIFSYRSLYQSQKLNPHVVWSSLIEYTVSSHVAIQCPRKVHKKDPVPLGTEWQTVSVSLFSLYQGLWTVYRSLLKKEEIPWGFLSVPPESGGNSVYESELFSLLWYFQEISAFFPCCGLFAVTMQRQSLGSRKILLAESFS